MAKPYEPRLAAVYRDEIRPALKEQFGLHERAADSKGRESRPEYGSRRRRC